MEGSPWTEYSRTDDKLILSPLDGPAALSMKVSVSSAGFHSRPDALGGSDPHWQKFLDSIERQREEQEVRHASADSVCAESPMQEAPLEADETSSEEGESFESWSDPDRTLATMSRNAGLALKLF